MALNGCFLPFLTPAPCPLAPHGALQKQILHSDYAGKEDSERDYKFCPRAAVKKLLEHKLIWCSLGSFWTELDKQNGEAAFNAMITPE